ncbi:MAG: nucleoside hydrolase [Cryobacterium sp.]|nr:nucleoside hydrolase [Cryobacterium sp.]
MALIIDCDPGIDDALALLLAFGSPLEISAITTVVGNVSVEQATSNAQTVLNAAGITGVPVHPGAGTPLSGLVRASSSSHGFDGLGGRGSEPLAIREATAVDHLLRLSRSKRDSLTIAALGPLTNIAMAIQRDADFAQRVDRLVVMGGAIGSGNVTPAAEFNFWHDPAAVDVVLRAGFTRLEIIGLDVTGQVFLSAEARERIRLSSAPSAPFVYEMIGAYFDAYWRSHGVVGAEMCDPLVIAHLLDPEILTLSEAYVEVELEGQSVGRSNVWPTARYRDKIANARVATGVDPQRFFTLFLETTFPASTA